MPPPRITVFRSPGLQANPDLADLRLDEITSQHAAQLAAGLRPMSRQRPLSPSAVNAVLRTLRHALNCAADWGKIPVAPKLKKILLKENKRERVVSDAEFAAYLAACGQPWRDIALLVRFEGLRPWDEAASLRWENVKDGCIYITEGKSKAARRKLPIAPQVLALLEAQWAILGVVVMKDVMKLTLKHFDRASTFLSTDPRRSVCVQDGAFV